MIIMIDMKIFRLHIYIHTGTLTLKTRVLLTSGLKPCTYINYNIICPQTPSCYPEPLNSRLPLDSWRRCVTGWQTHVHICLIGLWNHFKLSCTMCPYPSPLDPTIKTHQTSLNTSYYIEHPPLWRITSIYEAWETLDTGWSYQDPSRYMMVFMNLDPSTGRRFLGLVLYRWRPDWPADPDQRTGWTRPTYERPAVKSEKKWIEMLLAIP